jgi:Reverse transcriptase (RNA-dependent DNA polymerase)
MGRCCNIRAHPIDDYDTFIDKGHHTKVKAPIGYKKIRVHLIFDVKHDGRHKARMAADGHLTDIPLESVYSGVVSLRGFRIVLFLAELNHLELWSTDIGNAYLEAYTSEKVYIIADPEIGDREGHILIISKALYGLQSSGVRWHVPEPLGNHVTLTHYVDANLMYDIATGRSVTGILHLSNKIPIEWYSKKKANVQYHST